MDFNTPSSTSPLFVLDPVPNVWPDVMETLSNASVNIVTQTQNKIIVSDLRVQQPASIFKNFNSPIKTSPAHYAPILNSPNIGKSLEEVDVKPRKKGPRFKFTTGKKEDLNPPLVKRCIVDIEPDIEIKKLDLKKDILCGTIEKLDNEIKELSTDVVKTKHVVKESLSYNKLEHDFKYSLEKNIEEKITSVATINISDESDIEESGDESDASITLSESTIPTSDVMDSSDNESVFEEQIETPARFETNASNATTGYRVPTHVVAQLLERRKKREIRRNIRKSKMSLIQVNNRNAVNEKIQTYRKSDEKVSYSRSDPYVRVDKLQCVNVKDTKLRESVKRTNVNENQQQKVENKSYIRSKSSSKTKHCKTKLFKPKRESESRIKNVFDFLGSSEGSASEKSRKNVVGKQSPFKRSNSNIFDFLGSSEDSASEKSRKNMVGIKSPFKRSISEPVSLNHSRSSEKRCSIKKKHQPIAVTRPDNTVSVNKSKQPDVAISQSNSHTRDLCVTPSSDSNNISLDVRFKVRMNQSSAKESQRNIDFQIKCSANGNQVKALSKQVTKVSKTHTDSKDLKRKDKPNNQSNSLNKTKSPHLSKNANSLSGFVIPKRKISETSEEPLVQNRKEVKDCFDRVKLLKRSISEGTINKHGSSKKSKPYSSSSQTRKLVVYNKVKKASPLTKFN